MSWYCCKGGGEWDRQTAVGGWGRGEGGWVRETKCCRHHSEMVGLYVHTRKWIWTWVDVIVSSSKLSVCSASSIMIGWYMVHRPDLAVVSLYVTVHLPSLCACTCVCVCVWMHVCVCIHVCWSVWMRMHMCSICACLFACCCVCVYKGVVGQYSLPKKKKKIAVAF